MSNGKAMIVNFIAGFIKKLNPEPIRWINVLLSYKKEPIFS